ncbi:MAG: mechanosensitive ion channel family protein [Methylophaga sp.]|nr:mechanosensitive ion channel family protein [Methylophaga sp.]
MQQIIEWADPAGLALLAVVAGFAVYKTLVFLIGRFTEPSSVARIFFDASARALGTTLCLLALNSVLHAVPQDLALLGVIQHITTLLLIISLTWVAVALTSAIGDVIVKLNPALEDEWKRARKIETQTRFLVRGLNIVIVLVGMGIALMTFDSVSKVGTSLLASAGIGGIILGFAARPVLSNLLAGMQIALTQPLRIDDVLHVQGEWCWVEEVTATYVVLRVWDLRRLIVPLQWFIENPFQNWSRNSAELMGSAMIWLDYGIPVEPLREEFARLLRASADWNGVIESVQVVEAGEKAVQIRFLMSARNSNVLWNLRCHVREQMIAYIKQHYPEYLPRYRAQLVENDSESAPDTM